MRDDREKLSTVVQELLLILLCSTSIVYLAYIGSYCAYHAPVSSFP